MDNKGQVLIVFVLIVPLLLMGGAYIVDNVYIAYHTNRLNQLNELIITDIVTNRITINEIEEYVRKNDDDIQVSSVSISDDMIEITLKKDIKSLFGKIIGKDNYLLTSHKSIQILQDDVPLYQ